MYDNLDYYQRKAYDPYDENNEELEEEVKVNKEKQQENKKNNFQAYMKSNRMLSY